MSKRNIRAAAVPIVAADEVQQEIDAFAMRAGGCFRRIEPRQQMKKFLLACASELRKLNGWEIARHAGDLSPDRAQRLLSKARWDEDELMRHVRTYAVNGLNTVKAAHGLRVLALDESGQEKQGVSTSGVKRQYMGCAGRVANGINTVYASYVRQHVGHTIVALRQWIPREHITDPETAERRGLPSGLVFQTKGQIAADLVHDCRSEGIRPDFITGDEVYGTSPDLRRYCEEHHQGYILRVSVNFRFTVPSGRELTCKQAVNQLLKQRNRWTVRSAGHGSKGERLYAWAWIALASPRHFLLIRRHIKTGECAYHHCYVPKGQPTALHRLITAAGLRWPVEECFEFGKDYFGLDQSQVRLYTSIKRHLILVSATLAIFAVTAAKLKQETDTQAALPTSPDDPPPTDPGMIPLTIREIQRLFASTTRQLQPAWLTDHWSRWRRRHQARARWYHHRARLTARLTLAQVKP